MQSPDVLAPIREFLKLESSGGILLLSAALLALVFANTPLNRFYEELIRMPVAIRIGPLEIAKPLLLWINDGLMTVFFFLVGLELKRELREGELREWRKAVLPAIGALGGMALPALLYVTINSGNAEASRGWAIPAATDIAFALSILALLGNRVPTGLKVFLVSLAIFDDVAAILIIACFYTAELSMVAFAVGGACLVALFILNRRGVASIVPYMLIGLVMWVATLKSGVHATLAGVLLALFVPLRDRSNPGRSPLRELEHDLHPSVAYVILPLFAFANAGVSIGAIGHSIIHPVPLGIATGLFIGKQIGVFGTCWLAIKIGIAKLPEGTSWRELYGVALLCGVGFTMSLFIATLAFGGAATTYIGIDRIGILSGSLLSGVAGYLWLRLSLKGK